MATNFSNMLKLYKLVLSIKSVWLLFLSTKEIGFAVMPFLPYHIYFLVWLCIKERAHGSKNQDGVQSGGSSLAVAFFPFFLQKQYCILDLILDA